MATKFEENCYGMSVEELRALFIDSRFARMTGPGMSAMSILSDAQQVLEFGDTEQARQYINIAKYIISEEWIGHSDKGAA